MQMRFQQRLRAIAVTWLLADAANSMNLRRTFEISASGIDETLQGLSSDPFGAAVGSGPGLRVPAFVNTNDTRYLFLLASRRLDIRQKTRIIGWRELVTIGVDLAQATPFGPTKKGQFGAPPPGAQSLPIELEVTSPTFRFPDGNVSYHLVREPLQVPFTQRPLTDAQSFAFVTSDTPALLYQTASFSAGTDPVTGAPGYYMLNMSDYTPPSALRATWEPLAGLGNLHDLRTPYRDAHGWSSLDIEVDGGCNVRLYASVLQTNPATRPLPNIPAPIPPGTPPEWQFVTSYTTGGDETTGPIYWRVGGGLMFEDEDES
jgi:hypothetical protein